MGFKSKSSPEIKLFYKNNVFLISIVFPYRLSTYKISGFFRCQKF